MKKKLYTQDEFNTVIDLLHNGVSIDGIARQMGRSTAAITFIRNMDRRMKKGKSMKGFGGYEKRLKAYYAGKEGQDPPQANGASVENSSSAEDNIQRLEQAFTTFQTELVSIIDAEVKSRSEDEIKALKDKYEKELAKMQTILVQAKNSSMIGVLRKKWGLPDIPNNA